MYVFFTQAMFFYTGGIFKSAQECGKEIKGGTTKSIRKLNGFSKRQEYNTYHKNRDKN